MHIPKYSIEVTMGIPSTSCLSETILILFFSTEARLPLTTTPPLIKLRICPENYAKTFIASWTVAKV